MNTPTFALPWSNCFHLYAMPAIQKNGVWREIHRVQPKVNPIKYAVCDLCTIAVGARHYEQELYYWLIEKQWMQMVVAGEDVKRYIQRDVLAVCGRCAVRKDLPFENRVLGPEHWETTMLLPGGSRLVQTDLEDMDECMAIIAAIAYYLEQERKKLLRPLFRIAHRPQQMFNASLVQ